MSYKLTNGLQNNNSCSNWRNMWFSIVCPRTIVISSAERCFLSITRLHSRENVVKILQQSLLNWWQLNSGKFCALTAVNGWDRQERMNCRSTTGCQTDSGRTDWRLTMYGQNDKHSTTDKYMDWQICFSCVYHLPALKSPKFCNQVFKSVTLAKFIALASWTTNERTYCRIVVKLSTDWKCRKNTAAFFLNWWQLNSG